MGTKRNIFSTRDIAKYEILPVLGDGLNHVLLEVRGVDFSVQLRRKNKRY